MSGSIGKFPDIGVSGSTAVPIASEEPAKGGRILNGCFRWPCNLLPQLFLGSVLPSCCSHLGEKLTTIVGLLGIMS